MYTEKYQNRTLLLKKEGGGYPAEYLLSRIRGRRSFLITDWGPLLSDATPLESLPPSWRRGLELETSPAALWRLLLAEYRWVYLQMEDTLKETFMPFFLYSELRTLFFCLRYKAAGEDAKMEQILTHSLLSNEFKKALMGGEQLLDVLEEIERFFSSLSSRFGGLGDIFSKDGFKGLEQHLTNTYLEHVMDLDLHWVMKEFFIRLVDARNVIALYKHLRWEMKETPYFLKGGSVRESRLKGLLTKQDIFEVIPLIRSLTGIAVKVPDPSAVENALYRGTTHFLQKAGREISGVGFILAYLWRRSLEAMNLRILFHGKDSEKDALRAELI